MQIWRRILLPVDGFNESELRILIETVFTAHFGVNPFLRLMTLTDHSGRRLSADENIIRMSFICGFDSDNLTRYSCRKGSSDLRLNFHLSFGQSPPLLFAAGARISQIHLCYFHI
jgi:hypothetical protein